MNLHGFIFSLCAFNIIFISFFLATNSKWSYDHYLLTYYTQEAINESYNIIIPYEQFLTNSIIAHIGGIAICIVAGKIMMVSYNKIQLVASSEP